MYLGYIHCRFDHRVQGKDAFRGLPLADGAEVQTTGRAQDLVEKMEMTQLFDIHYDKEHVAAAKYIPGFNLMDLP